MNAWQSKLRCRAARHTGGLHGRRGGSGTAWRPALAGLYLIFNVTNTLDEDTSIHRHGLIVPTSQDGVPGLNCDGIKPDTTNTYRFPAQQSGTYRFHSHSGLQCRGTSAASGG